LDFKNKGKQCDKLKGFEHQEEWKTCFDKFYKKKTKIID
jgi:hypothetical protein